MNELTLFSMILFLSGCVSNTSNVLNNVCRVDDSTPFGRDLLSARQRISNTHKPEIFGKCDELEELKKGRRTKLSTWHYTLTLDEAKRLELEDFPLKI